MDGWMVGASVWGPYVNRSLFLLALVLCSLVPVLLSVECFVIEAYFPHLFSTCTHSPAFNPRIVVS